jgi:hypothetical protein
MAMLPIPIDVLEHILGHLDKASLAKICQLNKICCSYAQNVLYRNIRIVNDEDLKVCETLAQSTHLARRVRLFDISISTQRTIPNELLQTPLQNMTNLRSLFIFCSANLSVLDGCTFRLVLFHTGYSQSARHIVPFLHNQPSLIDVEIGLLSSNDIAFASTCLPNLSRICANFSWLSQLIPNRPVSEVISIGCGDGGSVDLSFFTLSAAPIRKLSTEHLCLYSTPVPLLASIFPSLTYLCLDYIDIYELKETVRFIYNLFNPNRMITMSVIDFHLHRQFD